MRCRSHSQTLFNRSGPLALLTPRGGRGRPQEERCGGESARLADALAHKLLPQLPGCPAVVLGTAAVALTALRVEPQLALMRGIEAALLGKLRAGPQAVALRDLSGFLHSCNSQVRRCPRPCC